MRSPLCLSSLGTEGDGVYEGEEVRVDLVVVEVEWVPCVVSVGDADGGAEAVEGEEQEGGQDEQRVAAHQPDQDRVDRALHLQF